MIDMKFIEFAGGLQVSKSVVEKNTGFIEAIKETLQFEFDRTKSKHFPDWDGQWELKEGYDHTRYIISRKDGAEVPDEIYEKYSEWNMDSNSEWIFGENYYQRPFEYKEFYWYAAVPKEFVRESND